MRTNDTLLIIGTKLVSGFYKVESLSSGQLGFIYKDQVHRVNQNLSASPSILRSSGVVTPSAVVDIRVVDVWTRLVYLNKNFQIINT